MKMKFTLWFLWLSAFAPFMGVAGSPPCDVVHDECVFDSLYPAFRDIDSLFRLRKKVVRTYSAEAVGYLRRDETPTSTFQAECAYLARQRVHRLEPFVVGKGYAPRDSLKTQLGVQLRAFGDTAVVLPTIYALIATKYGGDVRAYVDDLFDRSVMTNKRRMRRFARRPTVKRMREDMGFQFVVSKLMYRLWETRGRPAQPAADGTRLVILRSELEKR